MRDYAGAESGYSLDRGRDNHRAPGYRIALMARTPVISKLEGIEALSHSQVTMSYLSTSDLSGGGAVAYSRPVEWGIDYRVQIIFVWSKPTQTIQAGPNARPMIQVVGTSTWGNALYNMNSLIPK